MSDPTLSDLLFLEDFDFTEDGKLIPLPEDKGKVGLIFVYATWCPNCTPCKSEFASLKDKINKKTTQLYVINGSGSSGDEPTRKSEQALLKKLKTIFPEFRGFPSFLVVDRSGKVIKKHEGERTAEALLKTIESIA